MKNEYELFFKGVKSTVEIPALKWNVLQDISTDLSSLSKKYPVEEKKA